ncbi:MAG: hypothetical protein AB7T06_38845 [Kofleriaceae bacterium]
MQTTQPMLRIVDDHELPMTMKLPKLSLVPPPDDDEPLLPEPALAVPATVAAPDVSGIPAEDTRPGRSIVGRVFALAMLVGTIAGLAWLGQQIYFVITDGWIAPMHLSPDSDQIQSLRLAHQRNLSELGRIDAEVARLDSELAAIDSAIAQLSAMRGSTTETMKWQAEHNRVEAGGLNASRRLLRKQRDQVKLLHARQSVLVERARQDLAAGVIDRSVVDREEQRRDQLALEITELTRQIEETKLRSKQTTVALDAYQATLDHSAASSIGRMPEIAARDERDARVEIEIQRLAAEARGHRALRAAAVAGSAEQRRLLAELENRPLYRAMKKATDVAFVPYDQLSSVKPGASVVACAWAVFVCDKVGTIGELVPGEIATQDPWGEIARGQYAVLHLVDPDAVRERVLRVRP